MLLACNNLIKIVKNEIINKDKTVTGFNLGTSFEQYNNIYFSPTISSYLETLKSSSAASESKKKQKGDYFDTSFDYGLD